jgi:predicted N-formylglutamate amidohydrolase
MHNEAAFEILNEQGQFPLVLTCEHASFSVPSEYNTLGLTNEEIRRHIGWDIGARTVVQALAQFLNAPAVCSRYSRLLVDCNRDLSDHDLIVLQSDGTRVPGNQRVSEAEQQKRIAQFYRPYHTAVDQVLANVAGRDAALLSIHSFTPILGEKKREFDLGMLFDRYDDLAQEVGQRLQQCGYRVRYNEPYSGFDGLIFSARDHGDRNGLIYLELEVNNSLILQPEQAIAVGRKIGEVLRALFAQASRE